MTKRATFFHSRETQKEVRGLVPPNPMGTQTDTNTSTSLARGAPGSAGLDLAVSSTTTLNDTSVHLLPTAVYGPLPFQTYALLLGLSSTTRTGLFLLPGIIDANYKGEIKIMVWMPNPPCTVAH